jgi:hypothetical protein
MDMDMLLTGFMVETAINSMTAIYELIAKYEANGIDVIPIKDIKDVIAEQGMKTIKNEESLLNSIKKDIEGKANG